ncbi:MAG: cyclic pyranopterin monophosphate synthase MoaC [Rhodobacterales bacterium]|jgi:molybdenum cofactor biosynthesis protein MoaC|nr:MAG: cyclic pyranopterin monophosphate synthase MoaC [Rhodobacterales bacterium]|tara:strand:+ start:90 stop:581 length:492 start_codon:yes stop_codon:yes gene_type:complete
MKQQREDKLSHINEDGKASMVNINEKKITKRTAVASSKIFLNDVAYKLVKENKSQKGDVLNTSRLAGIMASKKTSDLIPLCHQINLDKVSIDYDFCNDEKCIIIKSTAVTSGKTGVEMEALMGATLASLTIYDMLKAVDKKIMITDIMLDYKDGGRSGKFVRD